MTIEATQQPGPFYLAVSGTLDGSGEVQYRILTMQRPGDRLRSESAGLAHPSCSHLTCRLANLGAAAVDWAYLLQLEMGPHEFHAEQMGFSLAPE